MRISIILFLIGLAIGSQPSFAAQEAKPLNEAMDNLTQQIIKSTKTKTRQKVAVIDFSGLEGQTTDLNKYLSEELITRLFKTGRFELIERRFLTKVLAELKLSLTGIFAPETMKELGQMLGADAIVTGTITDLGPRLRVNARIILTETGKVSGAAAVYIKKGKKVLKLLGQKIPGKLQIFTFPSGATIFVDNELKGPSGREGTVFTIPQGAHTVVLKKEGFKEFKKKIFILEDEQETLKVKFVTHPFAPFQSCLYSMIIPGAGVSYSKKIAGQISGWSAIGFYGSGIFYLIDRLGKPETFLSKGYEETYKDVMKIELYVMGGCYVLNVISSFLAGIEYAKEHKVGVEVSLDTSGSEPGVRLVYRFK